jgi:hypothetical protein
MLILPAKGSSGAFTGAAGIPASAHGIHTIHTLQVLVKLDEELDEDGEAILVLVVNGPVVGGRPSLTAALSVSEAAISCQRP